MGGLGGNCGDGGGEGGAIIAIILLVVLIMVVVGIVIGTIVLIIFIRTFGKYHAAVLRKQEEARLWVVADQRTVQPNTKNPLMTDAMPVVEASAVEVNVEVPTARYVQPSENDKVAL